MNQELFYLVCGIPYLIPTPTLGSAFITFFTVAWSGKANITEAEKNMKSLVNKCLGKSTDVYRSLKED